MIQVVKIGGHVLDEDVLLEAFCRDFAQLPGPKVLVHGGGSAAGRMQKALGIEPLRIEGRRVTDAATLQIVTMVYAGWCNKHLVALLQKYGCNAIGMAGCDASVIRAERRGPIRLSGGEPVDFGFVGDVNPSSVDAGRLKSLLDSGLTPVLCAINHDGAGQLLNTNADTVAASVAVALGAGLCFCFEEGGVLSDLKDPRSVISRLSGADYARLKASGAVSGGMIPKLDNAFSVLSAGAGPVRIVRADQLLTDGGTVLC